MSEKENDKRAKCPVCGRFCKQDAVDRYNGLLNERNKLAKELDNVAVELGEVRKALVEAQTDMGKAIKSSNDYEALYDDTRNKLDEACKDVKKLTDRLADAGTRLVSMQSELNELRKENERLQNRGFWARVFNKGL